MSIVTEDTKATFIAVVGWLLFAWGIYQIYDSTTQVLLQLAFSEAIFTLDLASATSILNTSLDVFFAIAAMWLGSGLLRRKPVVLRSISLIGWLYILTWFGVTISGIGFMFHATSPAEAHSAEVVQALKEARTVHLAYSARAGIRLLAESALILWVLANLKTDVIRQDFARQ